MQTHSLTEYYSITQLGTVLSTEDTVWFYLQERFNE